MSRYINAFFLKAKIDMASFDYESEDVHFGLAVAKRIADKISTADVEEVKHGHWIKYAKYSFGTMYDCSICSTRIIDDGHSWHYCPNCGAKMDGERKDEE